MQLWLMASRPQLADPGVPALHQQWSMVWPQHPDHPRKKRKVICLHAFFKRWCAPSSELASEVAAIGQSFHVSRVELSRSNSNKDEVAGLP